MCTTIEIACESNEVDDDDKNDDNDDEQQRVSVWYANIADKICCLCRCVVIVDVDVVVVGVKSGG